jgi:ribosomal protein S18 acetylase RimI-like enzyme
MLKELIAAAEEFGCEDVRLHVYSTNEPAQRLYYKHGFRPEDAQEGPYCFSNGACRLVRPVWGGES